MEFPHHEWLRAVGADIQRDYEGVRSALARIPTAEQRAASTQRRGHFYESLWQRVLSGWLPPAYQIGTRKYLLFEDPVDETVYSPETDLVVFHPAYPQHLRERSEILISGVVAAFSVKGRLEKSDLDEAVQYAARVRRGIQTREGSVVGELTSPLIVGVLANTQKWRRDPSLRVTDILMTSAESTEQHPRHGLDVVCIADLDCWYRMAKVAPSSAEDSVEYTDIWMCSPDGQDDLKTHPVAMLITALWTRLAAHDPSLADIEQHLQRTRTAGPSGGAGFARLLHTSAELRAEMFAGTDGPYWFG